MKQFFTYKIRSRVANVLLLVALPVLTLICLECYTHVPWDLDVPIFFLNLTFYYLLFAVLTFLTGSTAVGYATAPLFPMLFGLINYFVVDFRSAPIVPWDLYSVGTAVTVAGNYGYEITPRLVGVVLGFLLISFLGSRTRFRVRVFEVRAAAIVVSLLCLFGYVKGVETDAAVDVFGLDTTLFTPNVLYRNNGLTVGFLSNLKFLDVKKPEGYSPEEAEKIAAPYVQAKEETQRRPNVIVIMNEAFSDLSVFGEFDTDYDYMPFIHSLTENTVKGSCYVSVKGGNTANTEYEFLTGDSMAFLPAGSVPYQQYIKEDMPSLASHLKKLGYDTTAIHPYNASGWARNRVYPWLGFDRALFRGDFEDPHTLRGYIDDMSAFSKIIEVYEEREADAPQFIFEVTMQNHGGYSKEYADFSETLHLTALENKTTGVRAAEKYLSLILESDRALEMLVNYFKTQEEDTIILMFGDHQPSDYITNTFLRLQGLSREDDDVYMDNYIVPFVMWANFAIPAQEVEAISANYLSGLLLETAGIPLSGYQTYLEGLRGQIPAISASVLVSGDGTRRRLEEGLQLETNSLSGYNVLSYNHLTDSDNRVEDFFD